MTFRPNHLHEHPDRIIQEFSPPLHELRRLRPIAHAVIHRDSGFHAERPADFLILTSSQGFPGILPASA
jgi:hypothetical protein